MTTQSTGEALALLNATRENEIADAREAADDLIAQHGETNIREVWEELIKRGLVFNSDPPAHYLGAVFKLKLYKWTGRWATPEVPVTAVKTHAWRPVKIWTK